MTARACREINDLLEGHGLSLDAETARTARRAWFGHSTPVEETRVPIGASKLGGSPHLPSGMRWPANGDGSLGFAAQIDLTDLPGLAPALRGHLWFFYDTIASPWGFEPEDRAHWRVLHHEAGSEWLRVRPWPEDLRQRVLEDAPAELLTHDEKVHLFPPRRLWLRPGWSLPVEAGGGPLRERIGDILAGRDRGLIEFHQVLGYPDRHQSASQFQCEAVSQGFHFGDWGGFDRVLGAERDELAAAAADWRPLLRISSLAGVPRMDFGTHGTLTFWVREGDLQTADFDRTWVLVDDGRNG